MAEPPAKRQRLDFQETIIVCVGEGEGDEKQEFIIHKSFAIKSSKFFQTALKDDGRWKEGQEKRVLLPETKPLDFEVYLEWIYTSQLTPRDTEDRTDRGRGALLVPVRLYILGDVLDDAKFCNTVVDALRFNRAWSLSWRSVDLVYESMNLAWEKTMAGSPLRNSILEILVWNVANNIEESFLKDMLQYGLSQEIVVDLLLYMESKHGLLKLFQTTATLPDFKGRCHFHRHDEENPKCSESD